MKSKYTELYELIKREIEYNKFCCYGVEYTEKAKKLDHSRERMLTSEEHSRMSEVDFKDYFFSIDELIKWYFKYLNNITKLDGLPIIGQDIKKRSCRNILSLGSGPSVLEYLLKAIFQDEIEIVATDYDKYIVKRVAELMPNIHVEFFDFYNDDPTEISSKYNIDTIVMFGSACSMDDKTYERFLKDIFRIENVKRIYTFEAAILPWWKYYLYPCYVVFKLPFLYFFCREKFERRRLEFEDFASFHAYKRTKGKLKRIYRNAGWSFEFVKTRGWTCTYKLFKEK